ncbi:hypothetical protein KUTeg_006763 [Tegillarca granosa]|uniref:Fibronectin type-III domain-containing protein n=1 Tax=Tegillarca granosa TaxID=220873 RepID=A0ABQ9FB94_TEGGR|nr:hypothetical protein KUTeg_006763 [Tegillarca granosa]
MVFCFTIQQKLQQASCSLWTVGNKDITKHFVLILAVLCHLFLYFYTFNMEKYMFCFDRKPLPPTNITVVEAGSSFLYIRWTTSPNSHQDSFHVFTTGVTNSSQVYKSGTLTSTVYNITGLSPGHVYTVTVVTSSGGELSQFTAQIVDNTAPLSPSIQFLIALDNSSLMLSWQTDPRSNETLENLNHLLWKECSRYIV